MKLSKLLRFLLASALPMYVDDPDAGGGDAGDDGASQISGADVIGTGNAARLAMLDRINDQNDADRADELQDVNDDGTTVAFVPPVIEGQEEVNLNDEPTVVVEPAVAAAPAAPAPAKIKVNGVEVDLTPELIEKAQKIASADKYLEEASAARKAPVAAPPPAEVKPTLPSKEDAEAALLEEELALVRAIQMGTEEEARVALRKVRSIQSTGLTADDVGRIASERLTFDSALSWFDTEYKDLVEDENLHLMVLRKDKEAVDSGDKRSYRERYKAIGDEVRTWRDNMVKQFTPAAPAPPAPAPAVDKNARKASAPAVPVVASTRARAPVEDEPEESTSAVIQKMATARGGPQWARN